MLSQMAAKQYTDQPPGGIPDLYNASHSSIIEKTHELVKMIQETEEWQRFKQAEDKMDHHGDAQALLFVVKAKRNKFSQVSLRHGYDHPAALQAKQDYDQVLDQMSKIPLIDEYQSYQEEVNELIQGVLHAVISSVSDTLPVERGDDGGVEASGCGSCGSGGCGRH